MYQTMGVPGLLPGLRSDTLWVLVVMRYGLVSGALCLFVYELLRSYPVTLDASTWCSGYGFAALAILAAIVLYAFRFSLGGRPFLASSRLDD